MKTANPDVLTLHTIVSNLTSDKERLGWVHTHADVCYLQFDYDLDFTWIRFKGDPDCRLAPISFDAPVTSETGIALLLERLGIEFEVL